MYLDYSVWAKGEATANPKKKKGGKSHVLHHAAMGSLSGRGTAACRNKDVSVPIARKDHSKPQQSNKKLRALMAKADAYRRGMIVFRPDNEKRPENPATCGEFR